METEERIAELQKALSDAGVFVLDEANVQHGVRLTLSNDSIVIVYNSGKVVPQGRNQVATAAVLAGGRGDTTTPVVEIAARPSRPSGVVMGDLAELPDGWRFCMECGGLLAALWRHCVWCGVDTHSAADAALCGACGVPLAAAWRHCAACGTAAC